MRNLFPGYYKPSDDDFSKLWQNCIFTFDANMLLHVYRYTPETRENFFKTLEYLQERIWIPYQAASEYQEQRLKVIFDQHKAYSIVIKLLDNSIKEIKRGLEPYKKRHTLINAEKLVTIITKAIDEAKQEIQNAKRQHPNLRISDILREKIDEMFDGKIGKPYTEEELEKKYKEAEIRFERQIPPGYQDAYKDGTKKFGDVILWFQLIDHAHAQHKPIIFVTDDTKSDWWQFDDENQSIIGPRPELIQEMFVKTSMSFDIYQGYEFMAQAQKFLHLAEYPNVIEEIKEIGRQSNNFASLWFDRAEEAFSAFLSKRDPTDYYSDYLILQRARERYKSGVPFIDDQWFDIAARLLASQLSKRDSDDDYTKYLILQRAREQYKAGLPPYPETYKDVEKYLDILEAYEMIQDF